MFLMNMFGSNNMNKTKKKGKKKVVVQNQVKNNINPLKDVKIVGYSKIGYGPKKTECQDSYCITDKLAEDCYFFAVYDGHGSSGKEAS